MKIALTSIFLLSFCVFGSSLAHAAKQCDGIFADADNSPVALELALQHLPPTKKTQGLSKNDLDLIVEKAYNKSEGRRHKFTDYLNLSAEERTLQSLQREVSEKITHQGLVKFFEDHGYLIESSKIRTKLLIINRSASVNLVSAVWSVAATLKGAPPVFLPVASFKIKTEDLNLLLLKGIDSPEGRMIAQRYQSRLEFNRGYDLFSRYYFRFALAVFAYIAYDKLSEHFQNHSQSKPEATFDQLMDNIDDQFDSPDAQLSKEDILFEMVLNNFSEKYGRRPNKVELNHICHKVYGKMGCH